MESAQERAWHTASTLLIVIVSAEPVSSSGITGSSADVK